ncbi:Uncharacterised protein [Mycobacterium tuberculosis]|nr:Uncharacterised protein [Mycobacterium tuberculosis]
MTMTTTMSWCSIDYAQIRASSSSTDSQNS